MSTAVNHPSFPTFNSDPTLLSIEVTIDCAEKDLPLLPHVIRGVIRNSLNPIRKISVITPTALVASASESLSNFDKNLIAVISEESIISKALRNSIREKFPKRYGWVLHQFLTLQQILNTTEAGLLSVDSDTVLLKPMAWLNNSGIQVLMESLEYHRPYYELLEKLDPGFSRIFSSHVTHYSFFQKDIFLTILEKIKIRDLSELFDFLSQNVNLKSDSPFCVDREIYALGLRTYFPDRYELIKFSNRDYVINNLGPTVENSLKDLASRFTSISSHSYLQEDGK